MIRLGLALFLVCCGANASFAAPASVAQDVFGPVNCAALAQSFPKPYWLSLPQSRLVVNPHLDASFASPGSSGEAIDGVLPVNLAYYVGARPARLPDLWFVQDPKSSGRMRGLVAGPRLELTDPAAWQPENVTALFKNNAAQITSNGDYGAITRTVTVDLDKTPVLFVQALPGSGLFVIKVNDGSQPIDTFLKSVSLLGAATANVAAGTGWHGMKTFQVRLFVIGRGATATFTRVQFFALPAKKPVVLLPADSLWRPDRLTASTPIADGMGRVESTLILPDADTVSECLHFGMNCPSAPVLSGQFPGRIRWDSAHAVLQLQGKDFCVALTVSRPAQWLGVRPTFLDWVLDKPRNGGVAVAASSGVWRLALEGLRPGDDLVVTARFSPSPVAGPRFNAEVQKKTSLAAFVAALKQDEARWNQRLASVPRPRNFTPRFVASKGVTAADVRRAYYRAWVYFFMNTLPPMPENGFPYPQVCTGKPALWVDGATHAQETSTWDAVDAAQALELVDSATCWKALTGIMTQVDADGYLNGESLPPVFARAFWLLYQQTGDRSRLRAIYPAMKRHLLWMIANPRWIYPNRIKPAPDPAADKDQEYVVHEITDMGYAMKIASALGMPSEAAAWQRERQLEVSHYQHWFWPVPGGPVYRIYASDALRSDPNDPWSLQGLELGPSLLTSADQAELLALYHNTRNLELPFLVPGRTRFGDLRPITLGLFACGRSDEAAQLADACLRDVTQAGEFSESYMQSNPPVAQGVCPSSFGACLMVGSVFWHNGITLDEGRPVLLGMPGASGVDNIPVRGAILNVRFHWAARLVTLSGTALAHLRLPPGFRKVPSQGQRAWIGPIAQGQQISLGGE